MATLKTIESGRTAGVWAECDQGSIGLIAEDGVGAYLILRHHSGKFPDVAIAASDIEHGAVVQVFGPDSKQLSDVKFVSLNEILKAIQCPPPYS